LQPVRDISDPLNIREGNPDLKQEFTHMMRWQFTSINPFKNKNFFLFLNLSKTDNKIVNDDRIDAASGVRTTKPVNVGGIYNVNSDVSFGFPVRALHGTINFSAFTAYLRNKQFVNGTENVIDNLSIGPDIRLDMAMGEKINLSLGGGINYNKANYSLPSARDVEYLSQHYSTDFDWQLPANFYLNTSFVYTINNQLNSGFNAKVPFWNASLSKQFLRFNRGELKLKAYDILNQNLGISRNANSNYIEDIRRINLRRFFLLSFTYSLNKNGVGQSGPGGNFKVISR
jgi:hypothetical protein